MGDNIAGAIEFYQKRHDAMTQTEAELGYLHDTGALDDKAWARVSAAHGAEKWNVEQGLLHGYELKQQNDLHQANLAHIKAETKHQLALAETSPEAGQYVYDPTTGAIIGQKDSKGNPRYFPAPVLKQAEGEDETSPKYLAEHPSQDPSLVTQKPTPEWHKTVNDVFKALGLVGPGSAFTPPFKEQPEVRKAIPAWEKGETVQVGKPQPGAVQPGAARPNIRSDPRVQRIIAAYRANPNAQSKAEALRALKALGYSDQDL